ncbi:hypothetical protein PR048_029000 [Dryococelus australis]|uniref:Uncharacterized protein n=1 Tax=Dryococelus australis TaxID=614101 RepID=A0ABQ9GC49_9NEOP|nr:hypothetical protein PR048_029000 [Dryococelus australis]
MNADNFQKWTSEMLLLNLSERNVVVLNNASYHRMQRNKHPTKYSVKKEMINWLEYNNVEFCENMRKCGEKIYRIDEILKLHGHDIIRLLGELDAIELTWAKARRLVCESNVKGDFNRAKLEDVTRRAISCVTKQDWEGYCLHVQKIEEHYWETDGHMEEAIDSFIMCAESSSDSSDSSEDISSSESQFANPLSDIECPMHT